MGNKASDGNVEICAEIVVDQDYYSGNLPSEEELAKALKKLSEKSTNHSPIQNDSLFHYDKEDLIKTTTLKTKSS